MLDVVSGYAGGHTMNPTYEQVCTKNTGHAEVVLVEFDPSVVSYEALLERFWKMHDYTHRNPEGWQYRSVAFPRNQDQRRIVEGSIAKLPKSERVTTLVEPAGFFWKAEEHHQRYYEKHGLRV